MKRSDIATNYVLVKAQTNSEWDRCDFGILKLSVLWASMMFKRLKAISMYKEDTSFYCHTYWDKFLEFYASADTSDFPIPYYLLQNDESWAFIELEEGDQQWMNLPENKLEAHQLVIKSDQGAYYKAYGKHTGEEFSTENFEAGKILNAYKLLKS